MLVLHYTGMKNAVAALDRMCDAGSQVSAHYMVDEDGEVFRLVDEADRAWHAGVAFWRGETDINARAIGVELVNPGHEFDYRAFPPPQMAALSGLCRDILARHDIPARNVVGHSDIAPRRKTDPGELFDWAGLAAGGIGLWPKNEDVPPIGEDAVGDVLRAIGYEVEDLVATLTAFQRRFRFQRLDGAADVETRTRLAQVLALFQG